MNIEKMEQAGSAGNRANERLSENYRQSEMNGLIAEVNSPAEVVMILKRLNQLIETLYKLSDDYYTDYIFNASRPLLDKLSQEGFNEEYFMNLANRFETLRSLLFGEAINFDNLYHTVQDEVMVYDWYWHKFYETRNRELQAENDRLKKEEKKNG